MREAAQHLVARGRDEVHPLQPDATDRWVVPTMSVLMQPRLAIKDLACEPQAIFERARACRILIRSVGPKGIGEPDE